MENERTEEMNAAEEELKLRKIVAALFESEAIDRLNNIQLSSPELFKQLLQLILENHQNGRLNKKISDEQLKTIAQQLLSQKRESKININRK